MHRTIRLDDRDKIEDSLDEIRGLAEALIDGGAALVISVGDEDALLSPSAAAQYLGLSRQHVVRLVEAGRLDGQRMPGSEYWQIPLTSVIALRDSREGARDRARKFSQLLDEAGAPAE